MSKLFLFVVVLVSSCTISQELHFNKDFSGNFKFVGDISEFSSRMDNLDSLNSKAASWAESFKKSFEQIDTLGISNFAMGWDKDSRSFYMSFDFKNITALNSMYNGMTAYNSKKSNLPVDTTFVYFKRKGNKKLVYSSPKEKRQKNKKTGFFDQEFKTKYVFSFDYEILSVNNSDFKISQDRKIAETIEIACSSVYPWSGRKIIFRLK